jgi:excisionase family DNA binding protein
MHKRGRRTEHSASMPPLIDIHQVAFLLGVTERHVRRLVFERRIPFIKWGRLLRFDPAELEAWLNEKRCRVG